MFRLSAAGILALGAFALPAWAADYPTDMRGTYNTDCCTPTFVDPLSFEFSLRYVYSKGAFRMQDGADSYSADDTSHIIELNGRIDDSSTSTYLKANAGIAGVITGTYQTPTESRNMQGGKLGYAGVDFGYLPLSSGGFKAGGFVGYKYANESVDMSSSSDNSIEMHMLRLGVSGRADISDIISLNAEAAAVPFANLHGDFNASAPPSTIAGSLYGGEAEVSLGLKPGGSFLVELGGRASYLTGDATLNGTQVNSISFARYGIFAGVGAAF